MMWAATGVSEAAIRPSTLQEVFVDGRTIVLLRQDGALLAVEGICPHLGGLLSDGTLKGDRLICPLHGAAFDVRSGAVLADPFGVEPPEGGVDALRSYPLRVVRGMVEVDLPTDRSA